jgi:geranylgeranyl reductase family protein
MRSLEHMCYDAIVVGAGPAGCAAAYDLAVAGYSVLLVDKVAFPRIKACAGALTIKAVQSLRYSIEPIMKGWCTTFIAGRGTEVTKPFHGSHPIAVMTVRSELDHFCLQKTIEAGTSFQTIRRITGVLEYRDHIILHTDSVSLTAKFLIGADGANSRVRRLTNQFSTIRFGLAIEAMAPLKQTDSHAVEFDFGIIDAGYGWLFPKDDHSNVGLYTTAPSSSLSRQALTEYVRTKLGDASLTHVVGHAIGFGGETYTPTSRRIFLVGDAAGLTDPLLGEGIYNAIKSGQTAAWAIALELSGGAPAVHTFAKELTVIQEDLAASGRWAAWFYSDLHKGYRALTSPLVRYALMKGFASGRTLSCFRRFFFLAPFFRATFPPLDLQEGPRSGA